MKIFFSDNSNLDLPSSKKKRSTWITLRKSLFHKFSFFARLYISATICPNFESTNKNRKFHTYSFFSEIDTNGHNLKKNKKIHFFIWKWLQLENYALHQKHIFFKCWVLFKQFWFYIKRWRQNFFCVRFQVYFQKKNNFQKKIIARLKIFAHVSLWLKNLISKKL